MVAPHLDAGLRPDPPQTAPAPCAFASERPVTIPPLARQLLAAERVIGAALTARQVAILSIIGANPGIGVREMHQATGLLKSRVSTNIRALGEAGAVARTRGPDDERLAQARLTKAGAAALAVIEWAGLTDARVPHCPADAGDGQAR